MFHPTPMKNKDLLIENRVRWQNLAALLVSSYRKGRQHAIKSAPWEVKIASRRRRGIPAVFGFVLGGLNLPAI
jgi:hypothetical protein